MIIYLPIINETVTSYTTKLGLPGNLATNLLRKSHEIEWDHLWQRCWIQQYHWHRLWSGPSSRL